MLAGWTPDEITTFTAAVARFTESYEHHMSARMDHAAARAGSTN